MLKEKRNQLMDKIINKLGHENEATIWFCNLCEEIELTEEKNNQLEELLNRLFDLIKLSNKIQ